MPTVITSKIEEAVTWVQAFLYEPVDDVLRKNRLSEPPPKSESCGQIRKEIVLLLRRVGCCVGSHEER
jgi:hypothetical protein